MISNIPNELVIYQSPAGEIEFRGDMAHETIWASLNQIAELFNRDKSVISRHLKNIFNSGELEVGGTVAKIATVQKEGKREIKREIEYYNLDAILSVGYRVDSAEATKFRKWATNTLKSYLIEGYAINEKRLQSNLDQFQKALDYIKTVAPKDSSIESDQIINLISQFAYTWFSLNAFDKQEFKTTGLSKKRVDFTADELIVSLKELKDNLVSRSQATELFAQEKTKNSFRGIVGNVFQSFGDQDLYPSIEEKAAHLLYFIVKNHPFNDGNKRSGAYSFVWFLRRAGVLHAGITPEALTAMTLLIAESNPKDKDKMIGLLVMLLGRR